MGIIWCLAPKSANNTQEKSWKTIILQQNIRKLRIPDRFARLAIAGNSENWIASVWTYRYYWMNKLYVNLWMETKVENYIAIRIYIYHNWKIKWKQIVEREQLINHRHIWNWINEIWNYSWILSHLMHLIIGSKVTPKKGPKRVKKGSKMTPL